METDGTVTIEQIRSEVFQLKDHYSEVHGKSVFIHTKWLVNFVPDHPDRYPELNKMCKRSRASYITRFLIEIPGAEVYRTSKASGYSNAGAIIKVVSS